MTGETQRVSVTSVICRVAAVIAGIALIVLSTVMNNHDPQRDQVVISITTFIIGAVLLVCGIFGVSDRQDTTSTRNVR